MHACIIILPEGRHKLCVCVCVCVLCVCVLQSWVYIRIALNESASVFMRQLFRHACRFMVDFGDHIVGEATRFTLKCVHSCVYYVADVILLQHVCVLKSVCAHAPVHT